VLDNKVFDTIDARCDREVQRMPICVSSINNSAKQLQEFTQHMYITDPH